VAVDLGVADVLAYRRTAAGSDEFLVVLNFSPEPLIVPWPKGILRDRALVIISTDIARDRGTVSDLIILGPNEGVLIRLRS